MEYDINSLLEKWGPVLDDATYGKITDRVRREATAVLLENTVKDSAGALRHNPQNSLTALMEAAPTNSMGSSSSTASAGNVDIYDPVLISLVRRSMPNLLAYDVCGVQPMTLPTGLVFALRARYGSQTGAEALFREANTTFSASAGGNTASVTAAGAQVDSDPSLLITSGNTSYTVGRPMSTAVGEAIGDSSTNRINEMALSIEKVSVIAKERALKAEYSHELAQDLKAVHGLDAETELANILATEVKSEINREIIRSINQTATFGCTTGTASQYNFDLDVDSNGRWSIERFKGLIIQADFEANAIAKATRAGKGNFIITSSDVATALNMSGLLDYTSNLSKERLEVDDTGNTFAGTLFGRIKVFIDPYFASAAGNQYMTVGYKGSSVWDAGMFYCPYVPLQLYRAVNQDTFQPKIGFKTRYGLVAHPMATSAADGAVHVNKKNFYYRIFAIKNLM